MSENAKRFSNETEAQLTKYLSACVFQMMREGGTPVDVAEYFIARANDTLEVVYGKSRANEILASFLSERV